MKKKKTKNKDRSDWSQILTDIDIEVIPAEYLHSARITFDSGKTWNIDFSESESDYEIEKAITEIMDDYEFSISHVDFQIDTEKVKDEVSRRTLRFLKKRK